MSLCELFVIEGEATSQEEALRLTSDVLMEHDCICSGFYESCLERERQYPTGLTDYCPVAIPHTSKDYVKRNAICVLKLKEPVKFSSMEDWEHQVEVKTIFNLAFLDDNDHLILITKIIRGLKNKDFISNLANLSVDNLKQYLENEVLSN